MDMKAFVKDLKSIYTAVDEVAAMVNRDSVTKKGSKQYLFALNRWKENWDVIAPIFKLSITVRIAFYITNAIESLNAITVT